METEPTEPTPGYVFDFEQSDGTVSQIDFSAPGEFGDFAFSHLSESGDEQYFYSYHTDTGAIFEYFLSVMTSQPDSSQQFEMLNAQLQDFEQSIMEQTTVSESQFLNYNLAQIRNRTELNQRISSYSSSALSLTSDHSHTTCTMIERDRSVEIPHDQAWQFVAGIIWRSYREPDKGFSYNSRHSTKTFNEALGAVAAGLLARKKPDQA